MLSALALPLAAAAAEGGGVRWVLLRVNDGGVTVEATRLIRGAEDWGGEDPGVSTAPDPGGAAPEWAALSIYHHGEDAPPPRTGCALWCGGEDGARHVQHFQDPRHQYADWHEGGRMTGTRHTLNESHVAAWLPGHVDEAFVLRAPHGAAPGPRRPEPLGLPAAAAGGPRRRLTALSNPPEMRVIQKVANVKTTGNLAILSGAYAAGSKQAFFDNVTAAMKFLKGGVARSFGTLAQPVNRYLSMLNVFAVWQESPQDGAEHPNPDGFVADPRPNPLKCTYGTTVVRMLNCDRAETLALASYAPAADWVLVLVNDPDHYGGSACCGVTWLYNGPRMEQVLIHELGHAIGDASDEYDYGFAEPKDLKLINCAKNKDQPPWAPWLATPSPPTLSPTAVCSYSNYWRPTPGTGQTCLMQSSSLPRMCPVCREAFVQGLFKPRPVLLGAPQCPMEAEILVLLADAGGRLSEEGSLNLNPDIRKFGLKSPFRDQDHPGNGENQYGAAFGVRWTASEKGSLSVADVGAGCSSLIVGNRNVPTADASNPDGVSVCYWQPPSTGDFEVAAVVTDTVGDCRSCSTPSCKCDRWTQPANAPKPQTRRFSISVRLASDPAATAGTTVLNCSERHRLPLWPDPVPSEGLRTLCKPNASCNMSFHSTPRTADEIREDQRKADGEDIISEGLSGLKDQMGWQFYALIAGAVLFTFTVLAALYRTCKETLGDDQEARKWTACSNRLRRFGMIYYALFVWVAVGIIVVAAYLFMSTSDLKVFGKAISIALLIYGVASFVFSFFGFNAVSSRDKCKMGIATVCIALMLVFMSVFYVITDALASHARDTTVRTSEEGGTGNATAAAPGEDKDWETIKIDAFNWELEWMQHLRDLWQEIAEKHPAILCSFQNEFDCSGFQKACYDVQNSYCPANCTQGNRAVNPCVHYLQKELADSFTEVSLVCIGSLASLSFGFLVTLALCISLCGPGQAPQPPNFADPEGQELHQRRKDPFHPMADK